MSTQSLILPTPTLQEFVRSWVLRVRFPDVADVFISGDFNRWRIPGLPMVAVGVDEWEALIPLHDSKRLMGQAKCFGFRPDNAALHIQTERFDIGRRVSVPQDSRSGGFQILAHYPLAE